MSSSSPQLSDNFDTYEIRFVPRRRRRSWTEWAAQSEARMTAEREIVEEALAAQGLTRGTRLG